MILEELKDNVKLLNEVSKSLNEAIIEHEKALFHISPGIQCTVNATPNIKLGYGRWEGKWRLLIQVETNGELEKWPASSAPRDIRFHAIKNIDKLYEEINKQVIKLTHRIANLSNEIDEDVKEDESHS